MVSAASSVRGSSPSGSTMVWRSGFGAGQHGFQESVHLGIAPCRSSRHFVRCGRVLPEACAQTCAQAGAQGRTLCASCPVCMIIHAGSGLPGKMVARCNKRTIRAKGGPTCPWPAPPRGRQTGRERCFMGVRYVDFKDVEIAQVDALVVGSGFAGSVVAREACPRGRTSACSSSRNAPTSAATCTTRRTRPASWCTATGRTSSTPTTSAPSTTCGASPSGATTATRCWPTGTAPTCPCRSTRRRWRSRSARRGPRA